MGRLDVESLGEAVGALRGCAWVGGRWRWARVSEEASPVGRRGVASGFLADGYQVSCRGQTNSDEFFMDPFSSVWLLTVRYLKFLLAFV